LRDEGGEWKTENGERIYYYDDLLIPAAKRLPEKAFIAILPGFNLNLLEPYDPHHLVDMAAEYYQILLAEASLLARKITLEKEKENRLTHYSKPVRDLILGSAKMVVEGYKLVLLPTWLAHDSHKYEAHLVVINRQNGTLWGEQPRNNLNGWLDKILYNERGC